jgi:DNA-binding transcriptional ArsR family regulator
LLPIKRKEYDKSLTIDPHQATFALMSSLSAQVPTMPFSDMQDALRRAAESDNRNLVGDLIGTLLEDVEDAGLTEIARRRERVGRLIETMEGLAEPTGGSYALGRLHAVDEQLDRLRTRTLGDRANDRRRRQAETVREQVLRLIQNNGQQRPRDAAQALDIDPTQVSRALRQLQQEGLIERSDRPTGDRRAHVYTAAAA